jgi:hypothetical protein
MRTALLAVLAAVLVTSSTAFAGADARRATLRITDLTPLTVRGTHFAPRERVKLLVNAGRPLTKTVRAGPRGRFVARLGVRVDAGICSVVVQAIGAAGSRATADVLRPGCDVRP